jgi:hypothetical protein
MGKLTTLMLFLVALQITLVVFDSADAAYTGLWTFVTGPTNWSSSEFILAWLGVSAALAAIGIIVGNVIGIKTDFMVLSSMLPGLISLGMPPIANLANLVGREIAALACGYAIIYDTTWLGCPTAVYTAAITAGAIAAYFVFTLIDWWRGRD